MTDTPHPTARSSPLFFTAGVRAARENDYIYISANTRTTALFLTYSLFIRVTLHLEIPLVCTNMLSATTSEDCSK
jgi:hypothetical protein